MKQEYNRNITISNKYDYSKYYLCAKINLNNTSLNLSVTAIIEIKTYTGTKDLYFLKLSKRDVVEFSEIHRESQYKLAVYKSSDNNIYLFFSPVACTISIEHTDNSNIFYFYNKSSTNIKEDTSEFLFAKPYNSFPVYNSYENIEANVLYEIQFSANTPFIWIYAGSYNKILYKLKWIISREEGLQGKNDYLLEGMLDCYFTIYKKRDEEGNITNIYIKYLDNAQPTYVFDCNFNKINIFKTDENEESLEKVKYLYNRGSSLPTDLLGKYSGYEGFLYYHIGNKILSVWQNGVFTNIDGTSQDKVRLVYSKEHFENNIKEGLLFVVMNDIDLEGNVLTLPNESSICFRNTVIKNGTLKGYNVTIYNHFNKEDNNIVIDGTFYDYNGISIGIKESGTFQEKPKNSDNIPIGFSYFCTDKQATEGAADGIMIYHKGNNIWVDALGREIS